MFHDIDQYDTIIWTRVPLYEIAFVGLMNDFMHSNTLKIYL